MKRSTLASLATLVALLRRSAQCVLAAFVSFLLCPNIAASDAGIPVSRPVLLFWLLVFAFGATAISALLSLPLILSSDVAVGDGLKQVLDSSARSVVVALIILGPLVEEVIFRGWLTGTYRALCGTAAFVAIVYGVAVLLDGPGDEPFRLAAQVVVAIVAFVVFLVIERTGPAARPAFYRTIFPYAFWLQGLLFGGLHFANIGGSLVILPLLMTLPLIVCGWLFAYARVVAGIGSAWLLHALYNIPPAIGAILISSLASP